MSNYRINLNSSSFAELIDDKHLYIDKTVFIEHFLSIPDSIILITRPRRMGKSLNMDMLREFLDCKRNTVELFKGLAIENSTYYTEMNKSPVIFIDFKNLRKDEYKSSLRNRICHIIEYYIPKEKRMSVVKRYFEQEENFFTEILMYITENIYKVYGIKPYILTDEYDKILIDNVNTPFYEEIRDYMTAIFTSTFKGNPYVKKALLTGVTRISKESMFSGLNNISVYDVFTPSIFDTDFGLTENEVKTIVELENLPVVKDWYNNVHIGDHTLYNIYSVMSYLHFGTISNYWGKSGTIDLLGELLTGARAISLSKIIEDTSKYFTSKIDPRLSLKEVFSKEFDFYYYSLAIQAGYLTFEKLNDDPMDMEYKVSVPNKELVMVWKEYILNKIVRNEANHLADCFDRISSDIELFNDNLTEFINYQLSFFDLDEELQKTYHVFVFGMILGLGYKCTSNLESGLGRYDLLVESPDFFAVMEFKKAYSEAELDNKARLALKQIENNKYVNSLETNKPIYKIGIGCYKKICLVRTSIYTMGS